VSVAVEKVGAVAAIKNLLFATDFSEASEAALPFVAAIGQSYGSTVHLVHVLPPVTFLRPGVPDSTVIGSTYEDAHSSTREKLKRLTTRLKGLSLQVHLRHGGTCEELAQVVGEENIDLLIAGTHGRTGLGKLVMGSVAEEILRRATCPVLTVGPGVVGSMAAMARQQHDTALGRVAIRNILFATDFKQESVEAVSHAISLARQFHAHLSLLHVIEEYGDHLTDKPGPIEAALQKLQTLIPDDADLPYRPEFLAQFGVGAESILQTASESGADLVILGVRPINGRIGLTTRFGRNVSHKIIVAAHCPVLAVHA
jgi:nucleotide-binding universal stress UspA family protein